MLLLDNAAISYGALREVIPLTKLIAYYVVTDGNNVELDRQHKLVLKYTEETKSEIIAEFREYLNDKCAKLKELRKAVSACKTQNAKLVVPAFVDMPRKFQFIMIVLCYCVNCVVIRDQKSGCYEVQASELFGEFLR